MPFAGGVVLKHTHKHIRKHTPSHTHTHTQIQTYTHTHTHAVGIGDVRQIFDSETTRIRSQSFINVEHTKVRVYSVM